MDVSTITTLLTPDVMQNASDVLQLAIACCDKPPKMIAAEIGYSVKSLYAAMNGVRSIPAQKREQISSINFLSLMSVALEGTGCRIFAYLKVDRNIESLLVRCRIYHRNANNQIELLQEMLLDKDQLSLQEREQVMVITAKLAGGIQADLNFLAELDTKFSLGLSKYLQGKEKAACVGAQTTFTGHKINNLTSV